MIFVFAKQKKLIIDNTYSKENINLKKVLSKFNFVGYDNDLQGTNVFAHFIEFNNIDWHAGFCTEHTWNQIFSHELHYKQCDEIGDARINWELNRHLFLPLIAKHYYITKNKKYLNLFINLFYDWVKNNPFLIGISWTSIMEIAIRAYQWYVSFVLLTNAFSNHTQDSELKQLLIDLETGILNMMKYVFKHYSRYSSANNHLIVEMAILGIIGNAFGKSKWVNISLKTLKKKLLNKSMRTELKKSNLLIIKSLSWRHYQFISIC